MKKLILFILATFASASFAVPASINAPVSGTGWVYRQHEADDLNVGIGGANDRRAYDINFGGGSADLGMSVYAVEAGCIYAVGRWADSDYGQLLINHTTNGDTWSTGYLHMRNITKKSGCVERGEKIGEVSNVSPDNLSPHLHFAAYNTHGRANLTSVTVNFIDTDYTRSSASGTQSFFDGTGSLVDPNNTGAGCAQQRNNGCSNDVVRLHPRATPSTALFQIIATGNVCESVTFNGLNGGANIEIRSWSGYGTESVFYTASSLPATIPMKNAGDWNLVALTTMSPIPSGETRTITAECVATRGVLTSNARQIAGTPGNFGSDYFWGGNGSIIGHTQNMIHPESAAGYGRIKDVVALMRDHNTLSAVQVTAASCRRMSFSTPVDITVSYKVWDSPNWLGERTVRNGDALVLPDSISNWAILLIRAAPTRANNSRVEVSCF